jgi:hypothetical protein
MSNTNFITWQTFKATLEQNPELSLQFQYAEGKWVDASYHITEIKQAAIVSVDCGGKMNTWTEIIVQLWEPDVQDSSRAMQVSKALSIVNLVERSLPLNPLAVVKIEFGNSQFDTRQMYPAEFVINGDDLIWNLSPDFTQCKALTNGGTCGTVDSSQDCCSPAAVNEVKAKAPLINLVSAGPACEPGSGCC